MSRRGSAFPAIAVVLLLIASGATPVAAHDLERTRVTLTFAADGAFVLDVANDPAWLLLRLESFAEQRERRPTITSDARRDARLAELGSVFTDRVVLFVDGREIRPTSAEYVPPVGPPVNGIPALATYRLKGRLPPDAQSLRWFYGIVVDPYPLTLHRADGQTTLEWIQGQAWSDTIDLTGQFVQPTRRQIAAQYLSLGYQHILPRGLDHMLFVLGLFLLSAQWRPILAQVTTFTVAHSITLGLSMRDVVSLPAAIVEPLIALSIAYVAIENLITAELKRWRVALVFAFGLLHGMGFAGVLKELGLPRSEFLTALLSFNLGVEGGQLSVIAAAAICVGWYRRRDWYRSWIVVPASLAIACVGAYWTVARLVP
jgi:hydrogenase/urease accessory protein HupE